MTSKIRIFNETLKILKVLLGIIVLAATSWAAGLGSVDRPADLPNTDFAKAPSAPDFELSNLDGVKVRLSSFRGKLVVLNFWATWCPPCKQEIPWLNDLQKEYGDQLQVLGVTVDDEDSSELSAFVKEMKFRYPVLHSTPEAESAYLGIAGVPVTFFLDREGQIRKKTSGLTSKEEMQATIVKLLKAAK
jgi:peroxiredoxin